MHAERPPSDGRASNVPAGCGWLLGKAGRARAAKKSQQEREERAALILPI